MNAGDVLNIIENAVLQVNQTGQKVISIDALLHMLVSLRSHAGEETKQPLDPVILTAHWKNENDRNIAQYNAQSAAALEMFKSVISYGQMTLKGALLINGGAAVAMLALISNLWGRVLDPFSMYHLAKAVTLFGTGVLSAGLAIGFTYVTQCSYERAMANSKYKLASYVVHGITVIIALISFIMFGMGIFQAYDAIIINLIKS